MSNAITTVVKTPMHIATIENNIDAIVAEVKQEISSLNIVNMEVSEENKQTLKNTKADLNKRLLLFENERKKIKDFVLQPYEEFEKQYTSKLKVVITDAVKELEDKIKSIEDGQKKELEDYAKDYFQRKLEANPISFANKFENVGVKINLTTNKKRIREEIDFHFNKIQAAITIIDGHSHPARLRAIFEGQAGYDIGIALTTLTKQLQAESRYVQETPFESFYPTNVVNSKETPKTPKVEVKPKENVVEEVFDFVLSITVTESQLSALSDFMKEQGIIFELSD